MGGLTVILCVSVDVSKRGRLVRGGIELRGGGLGGGERWSVFVCAYKRGVPAFVRNENCAMIMICGI